MKSHRPILFPLLPTLLFSVACHLRAAATPSPAPAPMASGTASLILDLSMPGAPVSPTLYGLMTEEINHSYDGGLYAELIQNRIFQDDLANPVHWSLVQDAGTAASITLDKTQPLNAALPRSLKFQSTKVGKRAGVANDGFWGIPVKPATTYRASFYAKAASLPSAPLTVSIESNDGATLYAKAQVSGLTTAWRQYTVLLPTPPGVKPTAKARFVISTASPQTLWLDLVSLFPPTWNNRPNGNRIDIMQLLAGMKPTFLRFPGGNYLEGDWFHDRFAWEKTIGPLDQRPGHDSPWGYRSSDGLGLLEFLEWCEDLKMQPVLALFAGYTIKRDYVDSGPALQGFVDEALDEIQYVTGGPDTQWGARRAKDGHPRPFPLTYVEIGNEDSFDKSGSYNARFAAFYDAIRAKYPRLKIIATTRVTSRVPDVIDEHFYRAPAWMESNTHYYDTYPRSGPRIFVGEWATKSSSWTERKGPPTPNMDDALADAAWLTGLERNSDLVVMQCYAPLLVNENPGARQWRPDLIGYDTLAAYGSPSSYAQSMFSTHLGDHIIPVVAQDAPPTFFYAASRAAGTVYLKIVNTSTNSLPLRISLPSAHLLPEARSTLLAASTQYLPVTSILTNVSNPFTRPFPPQSITVLQLETH